ncbi:MAG: tRNA (adenosine(37)-N6)-dimethylallyltransferase MiaA [Anaerolineae bacterium]|nr:tRNA (adenosine(37)-N6)-dimethylallyltransferase MiaA [Anaerolineae bacterium]
MNQHSVSRHPPLVAIIGPTAVGKTALSIELALAINGEIVSADSRQIYRYMDIGTAKPTPAERARVPHHLLDVVDPDQPMTLAEYQRLAYAAIEDIHRRGRVPLLVGGTGLYVRAVLEGLRIPEVPPDPKLRARLEAEARALGAEALHARLAALDPVAAARVDPRNVRRVIRALEVCLHAGRPISELQEAAPPPYRILRIGLTRPRRELYARIDARVDAMIAAGLMEEVRSLLARGYGPELPAMSGLGYRQICRYLAGEQTLEEAIREIKRKTRRFVHQQQTWFRPDDPRIHWFDLSQTPYEAIEQFVRAWLANPARPSELDERSNAKGR